MGNTRSKKMKISQSEVASDDDNRGRINALKTDISDAVTDVKKEEYDEDQKEKDTDNASSASTVEVLDHNNAAAKSKNRKMPVQPVKLYYLPPSPPCRAVMMTARALGLELDLVLTNLMEGAHLTPEFLKMNPQHTLPTMDDSGFILWESRAILAYLVNAYGRDDSLYPSNPRQRAVIDNRLNFDVGTLFNRYIALYGPMIMKGEPMDDNLAAKLNEAIGWLNAMLDGKAFVAGDDLSIADISIIVTFTNLEVFDYDFSEYENVAKWFERTKKVLEPYGYTEIDVAGAKALASYLQSHQ